MSLVLQNIMIADIANHNQIVHTVKVVFSSVYPILIIKETKYYV